MKTSKPTTLEELAAQEDREYLAKRDSIRKIGNIAHSVGWEVATERGAVRMEFDHAISRHDNGKRVAAVMDWFAHWRSELSKLVTALDGLELGEVDHATFVEATMQGYADGVADAARQESGDDQETSWRGRW